MRVGVVLSFLFIILEANAFSSISNSSDISEAVHTAKEISELTKDLNNLRNKVKSGRRKTRQRRYSAWTFGAVAGTVVNKKIEKATNAILKAPFQLILHGSNFKIETIRGYRTFQSREGELVFNNLVDGELNQSFKDLIKGRLTTGDIISCRIPGSEMAEHYMMILGNNIIEVGVSGGKSSNEGKIMFGSMRKSNYYDSHECLYHRNSVLAKAERIDEKNRNDDETDSKLDEIAKRVDCTSSSGVYSFDYSIMSCNCQDFVLFWAYGFVEAKNCISQFKECKQINVPTTMQMANYIDDTGAVNEFYKKKNRDEQDTQFALLGIGVGPGY